MGYRRVYGKCVWLVCELAYGRANYVPVYHPFLQLRSSDLTTESLYTLVMPTSEHHGTLVAGTLAHPRVCSSERGPAAVVSFG